MDESWRESVISDNTVKFTSSENAEVRIKVHDVGTSVSLYTDDWSWSSKGLLELSAYLLLKAQELAAKEKA